MKCLYRMERDTVLDRLDYPDICKNASFKFDSPREIKQTDFLELCDGQWFLLRHGTRKSIPGRWVTD